MLTLFLAHLYGLVALNGMTHSLGRGGGTNLHPGNRQFRDLINLYRRDYLKARKNDKPAISRSIVSTVLWLLIVFLLLFVLVCLLQTRSQFLCHS